MRRRRITLDSPSDLYLNLSSFTSFNRLGSDRVYQHQVVCRPGSRICFCSQRLFTVRPRPERSMPAGYNAVIWSMGRDDVFTHV